MFVCLRICSFVFCICACVCFCCACVVCGVADGVVGCVSARVSTCVAVALPV